MNLSRIIAALRVAGGVLVATLAGIWLGAPLVALLDAQMPFRLTNDLYWSRAQIAFLESSVYAVSSRTNPLKRRIRLLQKRSL